MVRLIHMKSVSLTHKIASAGLFEPFGIFFVNDVIFTPWMRTLYFSRNGISVR
jgi:hypothetical protein